MKLLAKKSLISACVMAGIAMGASSNASASGITEAIAGGKVSGDFRLRMETVKQDNTLDDASALTLRSRLGYSTADYKGVSAFLEFENITALDDSYEADPTNAAKTESVVADPEGTEVNQAFLKYTAGDATVIAGRQRVILDNARFVGNVGWRQNEQTFDALAIVSKALPDTTLTYAFVGKVNTITAGEIETSAHLLNASYTGLPGKLTGYAYMVEFDDAASAAGSNSTTGLRYAGSTEAGSTKLLYTVEYAKQSDYADGANIDSNYMFGEFGADISGVTAKVGYEVLGAGNSATDASFSTPVATLHAFNGWSDQFLKTPGDGLKDGYVSVMTKVSGVKLLGVYHKFSADEGSNDYGSEINLLAAKKFDKNYTALIKYASYSAGDDSPVTQVDTDKLWVMGQMKF